MIFLVGCSIIIILTIVAVARSKKPLKHIFAEAKYELAYNYVGSKALLEDMFMKRKNKTDLTIKPGKIAVITGGSRGIGTEVVKMLLKCDIHVIIGCRNVQAGEQIFRKYREEENITTGDISVYQLDISSKDSINNFAKIVKDKHTKIHYLINNAGIMFGPYIETKDGYESQFSTNYLGHFLLTHLLLPLLKKGGNEKCFSRIVNVSSCAHLCGEINFEDINFRNQYIPSEAYAQSKLAQILFTNYLEAEFRKHNLFIQVHSVHPGIVNTELFDGTHLKNIAPWFPALLFKTPEQGATPIIHACLSPKLEGKGGTYIHNCTVFSTSENAKSKELQEQLFEFTNKIFNIDVFGNEN